MATEQGNGFALTAQGMSPIAIQLMGMRHWPLVHILFPNIETTNSFNANVSHINLIIQCNDYSFIIKYLLVYISILCRS